MAAERFTRKEADALLPYLAPILFQIRELKHQHDQCREQIAELSLKTRSNGHGPETELRTARDGMEKAAVKIKELAERVQSYGCELKDMEMGLIDFRWLREDREVYLCWKLGEARVEHWHELETGFAGRQPLEEEAE